MLLSRLSSAILVVFALLIAGPVPATCLPETLQPGTGCCSMFSGPHTPANTLTQCQTITRNYYDPYFASLGCRLPGMLITRDLGLDSATNLHAYSLTLTYWTADSRQCPADGSHGFAYWHYRYPDATPPPPPAPPPVCNISALPALVTTDPCTASLEANGGLPGAACTAPVPVMTLATGHACFSRKVGEIGVPYSGPTSTFRTADYVAHLRLIWFKYKEHEAVTDPEQRQACAERRAAIQVEWNRHGLAYEPSITSRHLTGRAFDTHASVPNGIRNVSRLSPTVFLQREQAGSPACTLLWGGNWPDPDKVHFELTTP